MFVHSHSESPLPNVLRLARAGIDSHLHPGVQIYVSLRGETLVDTAVGLARLGVPLAAESIMPWLSAGKPLTAVAILQLVEAGRIGLDDRIAEHLPGFEAHGKGEITLRHLLMHTAGLQPIATGWPDIDEAAALTRLLGCRIRHGGEAGRTPAYDPGRAWLLLSQLIERLTGRPYTEHLRTAICEPLGMTDSWPTLTSHQISEYGDRLALLHECEHDECRVAETPINRPESWPAAGASWRGPARDLGRFYEALMAQSPALLSRESIELLTTRQREGEFDLTFQHTLDFGLGVLIDSNRYGAETVPYGFGRHCSPRTFGHGGSQTSIAFADPEQQLVVVLIANGSPGEPRHQQRHRDLASAVYEDLGLTHSTSRQHSSET
jgi:CubicO group peptidase (beta-lactamase class C family)